MRKLFTKQFLLMMTIMLSSSVMLGQIKGLTSEQKEQQDKQRVKAEQVNYVVPQQSSDIVKYHSNNRNGGPSDAFIEIGNQGAGYGSWPAYYVPWGNYWENQWSQTLYFASEFGQPMLITDLGWNFQRIANPPSNYHMNVTIRILETDDTQLSSGGFYDMTGATTVFQSANFVPATSSGWNVIDIEDYVYIGTKNLIIEVLDGDNGYWTSTYYRTYKAYGSVTRMLVGYADSQTPPPYSGSSSNYDNLRVHYLPLADPGSVEGYVMNGDGLPISGATVKVVELGDSTVTRQDGYYMLNDILGGDWTLQGYKDGYNNVTYPISVISNDIIQQDIVLTQPEINIYPLLLDVVVNPNEYYETPIGILNTGDGPLYWEAAINYLSDSDYTKVSNGQGFVNKPGADPAGAKLPNAIGPSTELTDEFRDIWACNEGSLFGNDPIGATDAYWSQYGGTYQQYQQVNDVDGNWNTVTFWGLKTSGTPTTEDFFIGIYEDGSQPGAEIASYFVTLDPVPTGQTVAGYPAYQYIAVIETQDVSDFFISCQNTGSVQFYWCLSPTGTGIAGTGPSWSPHGPLAVCIEGGAMSGDWLSLDHYEGMVQPNGGSFNVGVNFDASGMMAGEVHTAEIVFTTMPDIGTITVPVTMTVVGDPLVPPTDLEVDITNVAAGIVSLSWTGVPAAPNFNHYVIKRNNMTVGTTNNTSFTDNLPDYGEFCYMVFASYDEGNAGPAGPECVDWSFPEISVDPTFLSAEVFEGEMVEVLGLTIANTGMSGSMLTYNISIDPADGFLQSAQPSAGVIPSGQVMNVKLIYNADGYSAGTYYQDMEINCNDLNTPVVTVTNEMTVLQPAMFEGQVTDANTSGPLQGVTVTAGDKSAETDNLGMYELKVEGGTYDLTFHLPGYQEVIIEDTTANQGDVVVVDVAMYEEPYPPQFVTATVNDDDTECLVEWGLPAGPYLIVYDDGTAENMFAWNAPGNINAVKFTPAGYPAVVTGGEVYVGDGFFPQGGTILDTRFGIAVYDDDGTNGMPGTLLDSIEVLVSNYGWVEFSGLNVLVSEGDFYLAMVQGGFAPNAAGIGIDETLPIAYRSYQKPAAGDWMVSLYQDFMMRAIVDGPDGTLTDAANLEMKVPNYKAKLRLQDYAVTMKDRARIPAGKEMLPEYKPYTGATDMRGVEYYMLYRHANFDPNIPGDIGDATLLDDDLMVNEYLDAAFVGLPMGYYKYCVSAVFTNGDTSACKQSNVVGHLMRYDVTINVSTTDDLSVEGAVVQLVPINNTFGDSYYEIVPEAGMVELMDVWRGQYKLIVFLPGYYAYILPTVYILEDMTIDVVLQEGRWPVNNLWVDPLTSIAYWDPPTPGVLLYEDFEDEEFPPEGWSMSTAGEGWFRSDAAGTGSWFIPPGDGFYAVSNDDAAASGNNACCDYLISPPVRLELYPDFLLVFDSFFDGFYGGSAFVEYSTDGSSWEELEALATNSSWTEIVLDLADWSGINAVDQDFWFRFHYDDNGLWADGWAVDNVIVASSASMIFREGDELMGYEVYLDGAYRATTGETMYQYIGLTYGQTYEAAVSAMYSSGPSQKMYYTFTSLYLIPPDSLEGEQSDDAAYLTWTPPLTPAFTRAEDRIPSSAFDTKPVNGTRNHSVKAAPYTNVQTATSVNYNFLEDHQVYYAAVSEDQLIMMDLPAYTSTMIGPTAIDLASGDFLPGDESTMYGAGDWGENLYSIDVATGTATLMGSINYPADMSISGMACDKNTGIMYVSGTNISQSFIGTIDLATGDVTQIGSTTTTAPGLIDIAIDGDGQMYGWCLVTDQSFMIDKETGTFTSLGSLGFDANFGQGGNWDPVDDAVYLTAFNNGPFQAEFRLLDRTTGGTTLLTVLPYMQCGMFGVPGGGGSGPTGGEIPENLLGYNVYRDVWGEDDDPIAYVEYVEGEDAEYYDYNLDPGTYHYAVTAVYDLTPYGFPGETDESMIEGPVEVSITYGYDLTFYEFWDFGNFGNQQWSTDCDNWWVNGSGGNPAPVAEFTWDVPLTDYECGLVSYPLRGSAFTEGVIYCDFDLKLDDRNMTGEEHFMVRIWENGEYHDVWQMSSNGDMDWTRYHLDITRDAMGNDFKVCFYASGLNSADIYGWMLDNIEVYFVCPAPFEVTAEAEDPLAGTDIYLNWQSPDTVGPIAEWLHYDDGMNYTSIGYDGPGDFDVAARFEPSQLGDYDGAFLTEVSFFPAEIDCEYSIRVWTGAGAANMVVDQLVPAPIIGAWNTVVLDTPVEIDASQELWFGYRNNAQAGFPAGVDAGPAVAGYGDMIYDAASGWDNLANLGLDYNWNLQGFVTSETDGVVALAALNDNNRKANTGILEVNSPAVQTAASVFEPANRAFVGYNIFRSHDGGDFMQINMDTIADISYTDVIETGGDYCYYIEAIFEGCQSEPTDTVCVASWLGVNQIAANGLVIYPNPARDLINVVSGMNIQRVTMLNYLGQVVSDKQIPDTREIQIGTSKIEDGIYFIKIETAGGIITEKVTIVR